MNREQLTREVQAIWEAAYALDEKRAIESANAAIGRDVWVWDRLSIRELQALHMCLPRPILERKPSPAASVDLTVGDWKKDADGLLRATIWINGCPVHLEAHGVTWEGEDGDRVQVPEGAASDYAGLAIAFEADEPKQTITIEGREYVLFAHAFAK